ncbi:MAG: hypothetical protein HY507_02210 [Candidatus Zambryskibacteria bacterium]|nr:hypothetical protein [Candidatus Zambryskibacteria bacterium]
MTKTKKIVLSAAAVVTLLGIYVFFDRQSKQQGQNQVADTNQITATTTGDNKQINVQGSNSYKIEQVPITEKKGLPQPIPDLSRPVTSPNSVLVSPEALTRATENILALQAMLKKNVANLPAWLDLAMYQKMAGDYQGTIISWTYAGKLAPTNFLPFANLGNLYAYFLKDNGLAEMYYKQAISKASEQSYLYVQLAEVYRDVFKDLDKARVIVNQGLSKLPNDTNLLQLKESLGNSNQ